MGAVKRKPKDSPKGRKPQGDDVFAVTTDVQFVDVTGDGIADFVIDHEVLINGQLFHRSHLEWTCMDQDIQEAFEAICQRHGIEDAKLEFTTFRQLVRYWKKFTKALGDMNALGDLQADLLGEPQIAD